MQCPDCKIYFDDEEKACPMCGRKRITMGRSSQYTITPPVSPMGGRQTNQAPRPIYSAPRPKNTKQVQTFVIILVVIWVLIVIITAVSNISGMFVAEYTTPDYGFSTIPDYYEDDYYNGEYEKIPTTELFQDGVISIQDGEESLEITFSENDSYQLKRVGSTWSAIESGWSYTYIDDYYYDDQYERGQYDCYELCLSPYEFSMEGSGYDSEEWELFYNNIGAEYRVFVVYVDLGTGERTLYDYYNENYELLLGNTYAAIGTDSGSGLALGSQVAQLAPDASIAEMVQAYDSEYALAAQRAGLTPNHGSLEYKLDGNSASYNFEDSMNLSISAPSEFYRIWYAGYAESGEWMRVEAQLMLMACDATYSPEEAERFVDEIFQQAWDNKDNMPSAISVQTKGGLNSSLSLNDRGLVKCLPCQDSKF